MRKKDVFGNKINMSKPLFNLILVFAISIFGFLAITYYQNYQMALLEEEQNQIQTSITSQLLLNQSSNYQEIESLLPYLPQSFDEAMVYNEMLLVLSLSELSESNATIDFQEGVEIPFSDSISDSLASVKINISFSLDDIQDFFVYLDYLDSMDRMYYVNDAVVSLNSDDSASVSISVYTFYMNN